MPIMGWRESSGSGFGGGLAWLIRVRQFGSAAVWLAELPADWPTGLLDGGSAVRF